MANQIQNTENAAEELDIAIGKVEMFIEENKKKIIYTFVAIVAIVTAVWGVMYYTEMKNKQAQEAIHPAEALYLQGDYQQALAGFEEVIDDFGSSKTGNTAKAYAGLCNKELGNYAEAIDLLKGFDGDDIVLAPAVLAALGDCYVATEAYAEAAKSFEKAANASKSAQYSPLYLRKAGLAYEANNDKASALKVYQSIRDNWFETPVGQNIDKYIERVK